MFTHLHVHTEYSLLDGAAKIESLVQKAAELGMTSLAITDHGVMYGIVDFYKACKKYGVKPIIGCEIYVAPGKRTEKGINKDDKNYHLVLLATNNEGYRNLVKIVSQAHIDGFYYKPRADKELLQKYNEGLIALSACLAGEIPDYLLQDNYQSAKQAAFDYLEIFGRDNFFLEIQNHGLNDQRVVNNGLWKLHQETNIPLVATNDVHYVQKEDAFIQDVLLCIQTGKTLADTNRMSFEGSEFYLKSEQEMALLFGETPEVLSITNEIANRCHVEFSFGRHFLPDFNVPEGYTLDEYLCELCWKAFPKYYPNASRVERDRLKYELNIIIQTGFSGYFLIVSDFCRYAREQGIMVGPGRGSAAASMVAYLLGITSVEPLRHDLLFERFLNPERISMPDIDIDFDPEGREKVIKYVTEKYGADKVCQIITFGTMGAKAAIRDVGRVLNIPLSKVDRVAKAIPNELGITLDRAQQISPELNRLLEEEDIRNLYNISKAIEGMPRHASTHAAGVVIAQEPLTNYLPLQKTTEGFLMTQFPMKTVEEIGLLKMDFLGLRNLTIITKTLQKIKETKGIELDLDEIPLDDKKTYDLLAEGNSTGVFQLESSGMRAILKELKPNCFEDIIAVLALFRPGPMEQIPEFIKRKHGGKITYLHPKLEEILSSTYGIIVYQEQVMQIAQKLAGYSLGRADLLRRAMGKKDKKIMDEERQFFIYGLQDQNGDWVIPGAIRLGVKENEAQEIFELMAKFAEYGFNKGHATAYAVISYQTAYLKANYPLEFAASLLSSAIGSSDKISFYIQETRASGIEILPPDVQYSGKDFTIEKNAIRFGLEAIRNVGSQLVQNIMSEREKCKFKSFYDFVLRIDPKVINKRSLESLIRAGAFNSLCNRAQAIRVLDQALELAHSRRRDSELGQISFFDLAGQTEIEDDLVMPDVPEFTEDQILKMEKEYIGIYLTTHPLLSVNDYLKNIISSDIATCLEHFQDERVILGGIINSYRQTITKKGEMMASFVLEDLAASVEVLVFPRIFAETLNLHNDLIVIVYGKLYVNEEEKKVFAEKIVTLDEYLATKQLSATAEKQNSQELMKQSRLFVKLENESDKNLINNLMGLFSDFKGPIPVYFYFEESKKVFKINTDYSVRYTLDLDQKLQVLVGKENVKWQ